MNDLLRSKWLWIAVLALVALISGGSYSDQITQMILRLIGQ